MEKVHLENEYAKFELEGGILIGTLKKEFIDLSIANEITNYRLEVQKGGAYPLLSNIKAIKNCTKPARDFMASKEGCEGVIAAAILIDSPIGSMIGNFFIFVSKPLVPTKIFTNETEAKKWLTQYVTKD